MTTFKRLFTPGRIGSMELKNRIMMSPMVSQLSRDGQVTPEFINYYARRARGGTALIVVEASFPRKGGQPIRLGLFDDKFVPGLKKLVDAIHAEGSKVALQVNPSRGRSDKVEAVSPSGVADPSRDVQPKVLTVEDIKGIEAEWAAGVARAKRSGADSIMIHGGSGYLVSQFLSPIINRRTDEYGGDFARRARFALEIVRLAREKVGPGFPLMYRLTADERLPDGFTIDDAIKFAKLLQEASIDEIDIVSGIAETGEYVNPPMATPRGFNVPLAAAIRKAVTIPVSVVGRICDPYQAEEILAKGQADFVTLGRALIADPDFPKKAAEGRVEDICPCIACMRCTESNIKGLPLQCTGNPVVGKEGGFELKPSAIQKRVLVVGGGPAGMEAAFIAAIRGHQVTLWEKGKELGGQMNLAVVPPHKDEIGHLRQFLKTQVKKQGVKVVLGKEATAPAVEEFGADAVVLANGPLPIMVKIAGEETNKVVNNWDVLSARVKVGERVVIVGAGLVGLETADFAAETAKEVSIVEVLEDIAPDTISQIKRPLRKRLTDKKVRIFTGVKKETITKEGVEIETREGQRVMLKADQIVMAVGCKPNSALANQLKDKVRELYAIGDCKASGRILEAVHTGHEVGLKI